MAVEYFGQCNSDGTPLTVNGEDYHGAADLQISWFPGVAIQKCPGSGTYNIKSLETFVRVSSGTASMRIGVFQATSGGAKICETTNEISVSNTTATWVGVTDPANLSGTKTLTGGVDYYLGWYSDTVNININYTNGISGDMAYNFGTDYSSGLPANLPSINSYNIRHHIRCGVEAAAAAAYPYYVKRRLNVLLRLCLSTFTSLFGRLVYALR